MYWFSVGAVFRKYVFIRCHRSVRRPRRCRMPPIVFCGVVRLDLLGWVGTVDLLVAWYKWEAVVRHPRERAGACPGRRQGLYLEVFCHLGLGCHGCQRRWDGRPTRKTILGSSYVLGDACALSLKRRLSRYRRVQEAGLV